MKAVTLLANGIAQSDVAKLMDRSVGVIIRAKKSNKELIEQMRESYQNQVARETLRSLKTIKKMRDEASSDGVRLRAAMALTDKSEKLLLVDKPKKVTMIFNMGQPAHKESEEIQNTQTAQDAPESPHFSQRAVVEGEISDELEEALEEATEASE